MVALGNAFEFGMGIIETERHGAGFYAEIGHKGGVATKALHGAAHYSRIGRIGGKAHKGTGKGTPQKERNT